MPQNFIISLNRGEGFKIQADVNFPLFLDLGGKIEKADSFMKFNLVGIVRRLVDEKGSEYYISVYFDPYQKCWRVCERNNVITIQNPLEYKKGLAMILFYYAGSTSFGN